ncbi:MAG TPA: hypothetical protein VLU25_05310 [Acidobacteriota bacterium]|nr:hypothetical protein [Acidobacteriota bacterium]
MYIKDQDRDEPKVNQAGDVVEVEVEQCAVSIEKPDGLCEKFLNERPADKGLEQRHLLCNSVAGAD